MKLYHGTTLENYNEILENGFEHDSIVWDNASDCNYIYFWNPADLMDDYGCDDSDDMESAEYMARENAASSGKITASIQKSKHDKVIILELDVPDSLVSHDDSCGDDKMEGAVKALCTDISPDMITDVYYSVFVPSASLFYIVWLLHNDYIDLEYHLSDVEIELIQNLQKVEIPEFFYLSEVYQ